MARKRTTRKDAGEDGAVALYLARSRQPLQALWFLLPLIVGYELAMMTLFEAGSRDIVARYMLKGIADWLGLGAAVKYLPGPLIVGGLLGMHFAQKHRWQREAWRFDVKLYGTMWVESALWALPLLLLASLIFRAGGDAGTEAPAASAVLQAMQGATEELSLPDEILLSVGAGIYEELLFRLFGVALIHTIAVDLLALPDYVGEIAAVGVTAVLFAAYHFTVRDYSHRFAVFYTVAGIYLGTLYIYRGFGIVAASHAIYDVMVTLLAE